MTGYLGEQLLNPKLSAVWEALGTDVPTGIYSLELRSPKPGTSGEEFTATVTFDEEVSRYVARVEGMGVVASCLDLGNAIVAVQESFALLHRETLAQQGLDEELLKARREAAEARARRMAGE